MGQRKAALKGGFRFCEKGNPGLVSGLLAGSGSLAGVSPGYHVLGLGTGPVTSGIPGCHAAESQSPAALCSTSWAGPPPGRGRKSFIAHRPLPQARTGDEAVGCRQGPSGPARPGWVALRPGRQGRSRGLCGCGRLGWDCRCPRAGRRGPSPWLRVKPGSAALVPSPAAPTPAQKVRSCPSLGLL